MAKLGRRDFLKVATAGTVGATWALMQQKGAFLQTSPGVTNPLAFYPTRDWERIYRDQYKSDKSFTFVCAPNCTHNCRMKAVVRNGVVTRVEPMYEGGLYKDLQGNSSTAHWNPRACNKGYAMTRRIYGPYRLKYPMVRAGWKQWADDGYPALTKELRDKYKFTTRGTDTFTRINWDQAFDYVAKGLMATAKTYSGDEGKRRLEADGYQPEMIAETRGAGTRTIKLRGGMGLLGVIGKYGMYRMSNALALLDVYTRKVNPDDALGGRNWSNYTWHGDQAPGFPYVHGLQSSEVDFNELRLSKLHIQVGKNLVENKMADAHFFQEVMERGGKIVTITPEYSPPATKSDYWLPVRPGLSDTSIFLAISKLLIDRNQYDAEFVKRYTDLPMLIRKDNLKRLRADEVIPNYQPGLQATGASFSMQGLTRDQYNRLGDYIVMDARSNAPAAVTRDDVGSKMTQKGIDPRLDYSGTLRLVDGSNVEVITIFQAYRDHLSDYDLDTVAEITGTPKALIERLTNDIATIKPVAIHIGEGVNHWFHATLHNRATYLPLMLTGNIGKPGAGCHTWAGNYKAALFQGSPQSGPGFKGWIAEDPFHPNLDPTVDGKNIEAHAYTKDEEPAYWDHGDQALIVSTPKKGRINFTGKTHMPTPTKVIWTTNVNLINNAKWAYGVIKNVNPKIDMIVTQDIEMTASCEYSDVILPANSWLESQSLEITASCSNPFLQIWGKEGLKPLFDTKDDVQILAGVAQALAKATGDKRFSDYWKFAIEGKPEIYMQRLLDSSLTTRGYKVDDLLKGKYGVQGGALMMFNTYPRIPFYEQIKNDWPFFTDTGRLNAYVDIPEAIEYGENFIVHREGPEATPYLPNVIVSSNPLIRPEDYGISWDERDAEKRTIRNVKLPWSEVKKTTNPLWKDGFRFYILTPKTRHTVHSSWAVTDWMVLFASNFSDPRRLDKRLPSVGDQQLHMNPEDAKELGLADGDYVHVDANPDDRPYLGAKPDDPFYKVARLMLRVKYNPAYPRGTVMTKHGTFIATERTVKAHETRPDGRAVSADTGYQSNFRYGSQQSVTRDWAMPMHQTDTLFHKAKVATSFIFGGEADNHAINTVPKETLVKITKAEPGGADGKSVWAPGKSGMAPGNEDEFMRQYLAGGLISLKGV